MNDKQSTHQRKATQNAAVPYFRTPALSPDGSLIAFCYAGDIWFVEAEGGEARLVTSHPAYDDRPCFSPEGTKLAFVSQRTGNGDVYVMSLEEGELLRLTFHDGMDVVEDWSPDGEWVYFTSARDTMGGAIYRVSLEGGTPVRLLGDPYESFYNVAVSPEGRKLAFNNNGDPWWRHGPNPYGASDIRVVSNRPEASDFRQLTNYAGRNRWPLWDAEGKGVYFVSDRDGHENIWYQPLDRRCKARQITYFTEGRVLRPAISRDGCWMVFERDFGLWRLNLETGEVGPVDLTVRADQQLNPISYHTYTTVDEFVLSPDGKKVVYAVRGEIFADFADKEEAKRKGDSFRVTDTPFREGQLAWSPDSKQVVYISDRFGENEVFLYDFTTQTETRLTDSPGLKYAPKFSPDGKWISFFHAPDRICLLDPKTKEIRPFIHLNYFYGLPGPGLYTWSPDSQWIAFFSQDENFFTNIYVQGLGEEKAHQVTFLSHIGSGGLLWSPDGKFLIFTTSQYRDEAQIARVDLKPLPPTFREEEFAKLFEEEKKEGESSRRSPEDQGPSAHPQAGEEENGEEEEKEEKKEPEPVEIEFADLKYRLRFLTPPQMNAHAVCISPDSKTLIFRAPLTGKWNFWSLSLEEEKREEPPTQVTSTSGWKGNAYFTSEGKKLYYLDEGKIHYRKFPKGDPKTLETRAELEVDFHAEKMQIFREAWTLMRDHFYDPDFHGRDWNALRERFEPLVQGAQTREDLREILNLMVGELNASHLGASGKGEGAHDGYLGLTFDPAEQARTGRLKIAVIVPQGPVDVAEGEVRVGDYLLAVDGQPVGKEANLYELLHRKVGRKVTLSVNDRPKLEGAREVSVQPVGGGRMNWLHYRHWVKQNVEYVNRLSQGRLGYVHIRNMSYQAYMQFLEDLDTEAHGKEGVVVDVRFNGGGHIATFILDVLQRRACTYSVFRGRGRTAAENLAGNRLLDKPTIVVANEHSGSNTEMFTEGYRQLGLGKVVGKPTAGAVIWTWSWRFLDGSWFRLPRIQVTTLGGEDLEGAARGVDIEVDRPLGEAARGRDSQLEAAVKYLLAQIRDDEARSC
ncbi:MAG TPA: PDZ domain-containing protein [Armatimonadetes bacterium]|nr:PDZ domain-containing protein [Armatimonadota bacterium]